MKKNRNKNRSKAFEDVFGALIGIGLIAAAAYVRYKKNQHETKAAPENIDALQLELAGAVQLEDYESAAVIRDKINDLKKQSA